MSEHREENGSAGSASAARSTAVKTLVDRLFVERIFNQARSCVQGAPIILWGEVIHVGRAFALGHKNVVPITLLDSTHDEEVIEATIPAGSQLPEIGDSIGIEGVPHVRRLGPAPSLGFGFRGATWKRSYRPDTRYVSWRQRFEELRDRVTRTELDAPIFSVALVTGGSSKAKKDVETRLQRDSQVGLEVIDVNLRDVSDIARGVREAENVADVDLVVVARGGGSPAELHRFNHPEVLEAIATVTASVPVLTAIGHTEDETWADQIASYHTAVPGAVADFIVEHNRRISESPDAPDAAPLQPVKSQVLVRPSYPVPVRPSSHVTADPVALAKATPRSPAVTPSPRRPGRRSFLRVLVAIACLTAGWFLRGHWEKRPGSGSRQSVGADTLRECPLNRVVEPVPERPTPPRSKPRSRRNTRSDQGEVPRSP